MRIALLFLLLLEFGFSKELEFGFSKKLALVIGNSNYSTGYLANPINDAKLIAQTLREVGFTVSIKKDLKSKTDMENAINAFALQVSQNDTVAIYYSGHGVQYNGRDYLMPTHANIAKKGQLPSVSLDVNFLLGSVSDAKLAIVMLDACRNNPYRSFIRGIPKGLGQASVNVDGGMIISYATEANKIANDGNGANSPYALALKKYIKSSDPIETVFRKVRGEVSRLTHKEQKPMTKMLFDGEFAFMARYVPSPKPQTHSTKNIVTIDGLMYQNQPFSDQDKGNYDTLRNGGRVWNWKGAKAYCEGLTLGAYSYWRLPTRAELKRLLTQNSYKNSKGYSYHIRQEFVENMPPLTGKYQYSTFWSSTEANPNNAWFVAFKNSNVKELSKLYTLYTLCVR